MPDFGHELALGRALPAEPTADRRGRMGVARGWNRSRSRLFDLYTQMYDAGFFDQIVSGKSAGSIPPPLPPPPF